MKKVIGALLAAALAATLLTGSGCENQLGECWLECYPDSGGIEYDGPYDDYTEGECEDKADVNTTIFRTCYSDWEAY